MRAGKTRLGSAEERNKQVRIINKDQGFFNMFICRLNTAKDTLAETSNKNKEGNVWSEDIRGHPRLLGKDTIVSHCK